MKDKEYQDTPPHINRSAEGHGLHLLLSALLVAGLLFYAVCLFKNISYPLMWADESMTAVGAERVLAFGYPKVHDGRNVFYDLRADDPTLGIDKATDAYIGGAGWGQYYFAAPFAFLARFATDIYAKTAILRIPFALAGLAGILILLWTGARALPTRGSRLALAVLFVVLELPTVTLMLHLREVRYYPLQMLLTFIGLCTFAAYHLYSAIGYRTYAAVVTCLTPLLFLTFSPAAAAWCVTIGLYLCGGWLVAAGSERPDPSRPKSQLKTAAPFLASLVLTAPLVWFFQSLSISRRLEAFYHFTFATYLEHLSVVASYFATFDIIAFAVVAKLLAAIMWRRLRTNAVLVSAFRMSLLLSIYVVAHALFVGKIPNRIFTRYFITLQPILTLTFALDLLIIARLALGMSGRRRLAFMSLVWVLGAGSVGWTFHQNWHLVRGRLYEISHQYRGMLDFVIPFLRVNYVRPDRLVIATNYEETSYIYYLGCRVVGGFVGQETTPQDLLEQPDCIINRRPRASASSDHLFATYLARADYAIVRFPIVDYGFNNVPETVTWTPARGWKNRLHLFGTAYVDDPDAQAAICVRSGAAVAEPPLHGHGGGPQDTAAPW